MNLRIAFRVDASLQMGSGHVMRCLTLADALRVKGAECYFICRALSGHLMEAIRLRGYMVNSLPCTAQPAQAAVKSDTTKKQDCQLNQQYKQAYCTWLGSTWESDAQETAAVLANLQPDWLVVDHYAIDRRWEELLAAHYRQLLVIDDLADRPHRCNLLLDQNLGRRPQDYSDLVPDHCQALIGPHYSLLRPEFAVLRPYSLKRRQTQPDFRQLLITMGGVDQTNATKKVLQSLKTCPLPQASRISVIMGITAPWLLDVREMADQMPWCTNVVVNVSDMAQRMADSDLVIGAAGSTSWERCCLGVPTLMVVLAENQQIAAQGMESANAARLIGGFNDIDTQLPLAVAKLIEIQTRSRMSLAASKVTDGRGVDKVVRTMMAIKV